MTLLRIKAVKEYSSKPTLKEYSEYTILRASIVGILLETKDEASIVTLCKLSINFIDGFSLQIDATAQEDTEIGLKNTTLANEAIFDLHHLIQQNLLINNQYIDIDLPAVVEVSFKNNRA